ncbi:MAG: TM2 domain-containing protein [Mycoplasma sp.]|nr:TM2 domain-containing protein [Mycoplasma sp.]
MAQKPHYNKDQISEKSYLTCLILCIFLPYHRFYVGKIGTGILYLLTCAGLGIWFIIDLIKILNHKFTDKNGKYIVPSDSISDEWKK